jgi:hypothetical protein
VWKLAEFLDVFRIQIRSKGHVLTFEGLVSKGLRKPLSILRSFVVQQLRGSWEGED